MERLTNSIDYCQLHCDFGKSNECFFQDKSKCYEKNIYEKLREYEDSEEQGLLLRLPCKVGDIVYKIINQRDNYDDTVYQIVSSAIFELSMIDKIGRAVFLTKIEAEQKLKEMNTNNGITE